MEYFVKPDTDRLVLPDGEWIEVKRRLTHGERETWLSAMSRYVTPGEAMQLERKEIRTALVNTYLVAWSMRRGGVPVPMNPDLSDNLRLSTIRSLSPDAFDAIHGLIDAHVDAIKQQDAIEKKVPNGESGLSPILRSLDSATGDTSGSVS